MAELIPVVNLAPQTHSSLQLFDQCPRQYYAKHVLKVIKFLPSFDSEWGNQEHKHLENYLKAKGNYEYPNEVHKYNGSNMRDKQWLGESILNRAAQRGGYVLAERKFAIGHDKDSADYWDKQCWMRGMIDVTVLYPQLGEAEVYDLKSGKKKDDQAQLMLYSASALIDYAEVHKVKAAYAWSQLPPAKAIDKPNTWVRADLPNMLRSFEDKTHTVRTAFERDLFPPKPSPLCGWCDYEACEFRHVSPKRKF